MQKRFQSSRAPFEADPNNGARTDFARAMTREAFGRFYADDRQLSQVKETNAKALQRVKQARKESQKASAKSRRQAATSASG